MLLERVTCWTFVVLWRQRKMGTLLHDAATDRPHAIRQAIIACRKGGTVFTLGVFVGLVDKLTLRALMNEGLTLRGAQQHGERYIPMLSPESQVSGAI
jgi:threonine dehydrogenase-like Zn-dependent dehydrogenase